MLPLGELLGTYILESALNTLSVIYDSALAASVTSNYRNSTGTLIRSDGQTTRKHNAYGPIHRMGRHKHDMS